MHTYKHTSKHTTTQATIIHYHYHHRTSAQGKLGIFGHCITLVQNDQLELIFAASECVWVCEKEKKERGASGWQHSPTTYNPKHPPFSSLCVYATRSTQLHILEEHTGACKLLNLLSHNANAAIVRRIELEYHVGTGAAIHLICKGQDGGRFTSARWAVEEQMREAIGVQQALDYESVRES